MASSNETRRTTSNTVNTRINHAQISNVDGGLVKSVDKEFVGLGDTINYTIALRNTGSVSANNIVFFDTIPSGSTFVANSVIVNGIPQSGASPAPPTGVPIGTLAPGAASIISFQAMVNTTPAVDIINNTSNVIYNYTVDPANPNGQNANNSSNTVTSNVINAQLSNLIKTVDKTFADIGDTINYSSNFNNGGNTPLNNVIFKDTIPNGTVLVPNSLNVNGVPTNGDPQSGINIGTLAIGASSTVSFQVLVNTIPVPNPIPNNSRVSFTYTVNPQNPDGRSNEVISNLVNTSVSNANFGTALKTAKPLYVGLGDTIVYSLVYQNTGNTDAHNVIVLDTIPNGLTLIPNSVTINSVPQPGANPSTGISLGTMSVGATATISFSVITNTIPNTLANQSYINYSYTNDPNLPDKAGSNATNIVYINDVQNAITTVKTLDKKFVSIGDTITYTLSLNNIGNVAANNIVSYDTIPTGTKFVPGSITINNTPALGANLNSGVSLGTIAPGTSTTVTFKVIVDTIPSPNILNNSFDTSFNYTLNPSIPNGISVRNTSNIVTSTINDAIIGKGPNGFVKKPNKLYADVGDEITYTMFLSNTGNVPGNNVILYDTIPNNTTFVPNSVYIDGTQLIGVDPESGISLGTINPNNSVTITFKVKVNTIPTPNVISNQASINYTYTKNPKYPNGEIAKGTSNLSTVTVNHGDIPNSDTENGPYFLKSANVKFAKRGDTIIYTFSVPNTGNVPINNVILKDTIPAGTSLVPNSVILNGGILTGANPQTGILLGKINPGQSSTLSFKVIVDTIPTSSNAENTGVISYDYLVDPNLPPINKVCLSNLVKIPIGDANVSITNQVNKQFTQIGDNITYTLTVNNTGNLDALNLLITDGIPEGTEFIPGSILVDGNPYQIGDPEKGISLSQLKSDEVSVIEFSVNVVSIPSIGQITNQASVAYEYTLDPNMPPIQSSSISNEVITVANSVDFKFNKKSTPEYASIGDIITFSCNASNTGNIDATNVVFKDAIPLGTEFIPNSVIINNVPVPGTNPENGIPLGSIKPYIPQLISFKVKILEIPKINPITNIASISYESLVDPTQPPSLGYLVSNTTNTQVNSTDININQQSSCDAAVIGDIVNYTVTITNKGNIDSTNFILSSQLPPQLEFQQGTVNIDGKLDLMSNIISGIYIGTVKSNTPIVINFDAKVIDVPEGGIIASFSTGSYEFTVDPNKPPRQGSIDSNMTVISVGVADLVLSKSSDKEVVILGDIITYSIQIKNTGTIKANNIIVQDDLPEQLEFVKNSLQLNNNQINSVNIQSGINIGYLESTEEALLSYKAKFVKTCCRCEIINKAYATFEFKPSINCNEQTKTTSPVSVSVRASSPTFKEITQDGVLVIPYPKLEIADLNNLTAEVEITNYHVIKTVKGVSDENRRLTGHKLIINGIVNQTLEYTANDEVQSVHSACFQRKFSSFIILPEDFQVGAHITVKGLVEDVSYNQLNCREVFSNITILLEALVLC